MDKKPTKRQHYVPQMYLKNFRATETDKSVRMKENMLSCYLINHDKCFNTVESKICQEENLYEFDMQNSLNYIEERFKENVEDLIAPLIRDTIKKCDNSKNGDMILSNEDIELYSRYMIIQILRHPEMIKLLNPELLRKVNESSIEIENNKIIKGALLYSMSDLESIQLENIFLNCIKSHTFVILKSKGFSFFTSDKAVLFNYIGIIDKEKWICNNFIDYSDLLLPLSPKYCLVALNRVEEHDSSINGSFIEDYILEFEDFLKIIAQNTKIIISDKITDETILFIKKYFSENKLLWDKEKEEIFNRFEEIYGYRPL